MQAQTEFGKLEEAFVSRPEGRSCRLLLGFSSCWASPSLFAVLRRLLRRRRPESLGAPARLDVDSSTDRVSRIPASAGPNRAPRVDPDGSVVLLDDGFEGDFPGSWDVYWATTEAWWWPTSQRVAAGSKSVWCARGGAAAGPTGGPYPPNMNTWMIFGPFSLADATAAAAAFSYWLDCEGPVGSSYYDYLFWGVSLDGDSFYGTKVAGSSGGWKPASLDFASVTSISVLGKSQVWFGIAFKSDSSVGEGAYVDSVQLTKTTAGPTCSLVCSASAPAAGVVGSAVSFQGSATATGCSSSPTWSWKFGDQATSTAQNPTHVYTSPGTYNWTLDVSAGGTTCSKNGSVTITSGGGTLPNAWWIPVASRGAGSGGASGGATWRSSTRGRRRPRPRSGSTAPPG